MTPPGVATTEEGGGQISAGADRFQLEGPEGSPSFRRRSGEIKRLSTMRPGDHEDVREMDAVRHGSPGFGLLFTPGEGALGYEAPTR